MENDVVSSFGFEGVLMPDGGTVNFVEGHAGKAKLETVMYKKDGKSRVLGVSMVKEWTPRHKWIEIAQRYLSTEK
jgi:hypothetical protein